MSKVTKKKKPKRSIREKIDPKIYHSKNPNDTAPVLRILSKLKELSDGNHRGLITSLSTNKALPKSLICIYNETNYYNTYSTTRQVSPENFFYWALGIFFNKAEELKSFNSLRNEFNAALLSSDTSRATDILAQIDKISLSWWTIENRVHTTKEIERKDTKEAIKYLERIFTNKDTSNRQKELLLLSESNSVDFFVDTTIGKLTEFRHSKLNNTASRASCASSMTLPISLDPLREMKISDLFVYRNESIIDQYILLKNIVCEIYAKERNLPANISELLKKLATTIEDDELLNILGENTSESMLVHKAVADYTKGNYAQVVSDIRDALLNKSAHVFGLVELYARAKVYTNDKHDKCFFDQIANSISSIITLDSSSPERIEYLNKICVKFRNELWCRSLSFHLLSTLKEISNNKSIELSRRLTVGLGRLNTPKADTQTTTLPIDTDIDATKIPYHRAVRYNIYQNKDTAFERSSFPILSDYLSLQAKIYAQNEEWLKLVEFSIREYLNNKIAFIFLPINNLCKEILKLSNHDDQSYISSLVILDIYGREQNSAYDESKTELFEEWLEHKGTHLPSAIFEGKTLTNTEVYFLVNICTPNQLDNIPSYHNNFSVVYERVTILNLLISSEKDSDGSLAREKVRIIESLFADELRAKMETGKLFVDVQALEIHRKHVYKSLFEHAKLITGGIVLNELDTEAETESSADILDLEKDAGGVSFVVPTNEKTEVLTRIFMQAAKDFALSENYGLDKYLSAEIRHVVFVEQLRSCFEKTKLITMIENGVYLSNEFWLDKYHYVQRQTLDKIDEAFKQFSKNIDETLKLVNSKFRVGVDFKESGDYIFDFSSYYNQVVKVSRIIDKHDDFEGFFRSLLDLMWEISSEHAREAQMLINDKLKHSIIEELDSLETKITQARGSIRMAELMQELRNVRSYFNNEIEVVLNWFRPVGTDDADSFERLGIVIDAAVASFESFYSHKNLELTFTQTKTPLTLSYRESRALFIAIFTALENSFRYNFGGKPIIVKHESYPDADIIEVSNHADMDKFHDPNSFIQRQKGRWTDSNSNLSREEGGTGLYKIHNLLLNSSKGFKFDINFDDCSFVATVRLENENFTHRG